jgi:hypothetical protein
VAARNIFLCGLATCALLTQGCGGGEAREATGTSAGTATTASSAFAQADLICRAMQRRVRDALARVPPSVEGRLGPEDVRKRAAAALKYVLPQFDAALAELDRLEPPRERRAEWDRFLDSFRSFVSRSRLNLARAKRSGDVAFFQRALAEREGLVDRLTAAAIQARVPRCAPT